MKKSLKSLSRIVIINFIFFFTFISLLSKQIYSVKISSAGSKVIPSGITLSTTQSVNISSTSDSDPPKLSPTSPPDLFSQLSTHNNRSSCWFIIDGHLYDITSFFGSHPGGDDIMLKYCGTDASSGFHTKDKMIPADHSASAKAMLQQYLIQ
ncbi:MAG: cytochrome b5-like heme/steroid binding domain-containing protein [Patescibacteria group bacterium]|jgi:hypothetical protein